MTVLVEHSSESSSRSHSEGRIVGMAQWLPPNKRLALWHIKTLYNSGIVGMLKEWGLSGLLVSRFQFIPDIIF